MRLVIIIKKINRIIPKLKVSNLFETFFIYRNKNTRMRLLKYFENFLNDEEKAYIKIHSFYYTETVGKNSSFLSIYSEPGSSIDKYPQNFDKYEMEQIEKILKPDFKKVNFVKFFDKDVPNLKKLSFSKDDFSLDIFKDNNDYYYVRYIKKNKAQFFECDYKDGLINLISDLKNGKFDYYYSDNIILVGSKTNLLRDMQERYQTETFGDEIYYYDNGYHFGTLYKEGRFLELRHDGSLDENGRRKK